MEKFPVFDLSYKITLSCYFALTVLITLTSSLSNVSHFSFFLLFIGVLKIRLDLLEWISFYQFFVDSSFSASSFSHLLFSPSTSFVIWQTAFEMLVLYFVSISLTFSGGPGFSSTPPVELHCILKKKKKTSNNYD